MIKILAISGSPVVDSSTDFLLQYISDKTSEELSKQNEQVESSFIKLNDLTFIPCQSCGKAPTPKYCFYDDLNEPYQKLAECDLLLFGSPIYFDSVSAQAKAFIDRCNCIRPPDFENKYPDHDFIKLLNRKKPGAIILVGGEKTWFEGARRSIAGFFKWIEVVNEGLITYGTPDFNLKTTVKDDIEKLQEATTLVKHLVAKIIEQEKSDD